MSRPNIFKSNNNNNNKINSRFSFIDEELKQAETKEINLPPRQQNNLFFHRPKIAEQPKINNPQVIINDANSFPVLCLGKKIASPNTPVETTPINSYSKAIKHENTVIVLEEDKDVLRRKSVKPGWISIFKNKSGKTEVVYGPKTQEEKRKEFEDSSMNYQMYLAITRMEERWALEKQRYDAIHGENAYNEAYGYTPTYDSDDESDDSDDDSEYDSE